MFSIGLKNAFQAERFMHHMRVMDVPPRVGRGNRRQICVRDKERAELFNMFNTRFELHRKGKRNKTDYSNEQETSTSGGGRDHLQGMRSQVLHSQNLRRVFIGLHQGDLHC